MCGMPPVPSKPARKRRARAARAIRKLVVSVALLSTLASAMAVDGTYDPADADDILGDAKAPLECRVGEQYLQQIPLTLI